MTKSPGETVKLHRASFRQNVFDISGTGGYNKDVETPTVATNIEQLSVCEFFIHKPVSRLIAVDGSLFSFSKPVDDLANQPEDWMGLGFGGKKSVKGNRQGVLSRSITRRSGKLQNNKLQINILQFCRQLGEKPVRDF